jgi:hypothetical protein
MIALAHRDAGTMGVDARSKVNESALVLHGCRLG